MNYASYGPDQAAYATRLVPIFEDSPTFPPATEPALREEYY